MHHANVPGGFFGYCAVMSTHTHVCMIREKSTVTKVEGIFQVCQYLATDGVPRKGRYVRSGCRSMA